MLPRSEDLADAGGRRQECPDLGECSVEALSPVCLGAIDHQEARAQGVLADQCAPRTPGRYPQPSNLAALRLQAVEAVERQRDVPVTLRPQSSELGPESLHGLVAS